MTLNDLYLRRSGSDFGRPQSTTDKTGREDSRRGTRPAGSTQFLQDGTQFDNETTENEPMQLRRCRTNPNPNPVLPPGRERLPVKLLLFFFSILNFSLKKPPH